MIQKLLSRPSLILIFGQSLIDEIFCFITDMLKSWFIEVNGIVNNHMFYFLFSFAWEWISSRQKHVSDDSDAPDVYLFVVNLTLNDFWSHVKRTSKN
jgi:hypothetical protein